MERTHNLSRMGLRDLVRVYFTYPAILAYVLLSLASGALAIHWAAPHGRYAPLAAALAVAWVLYPLAWYLLHRFVLHGRFLYRHPATAAAWKRVHFDHHQDPNDMRVLFGALYTTCLV
ncbi:MAG: hypothetical protein IRY94_21245 [Rhodospirillaceae bacterium]|nr:hypothetical protein [Rhodospirillaceae bacterium]